MIIEAVRSKGDYFSVDWLRKVDSRMEFYGAGQISLRLRLKIYSLSLKRIWPLREGDRIESLWGGFYLVSGVKISRFWKWKLRLFIRMRLRIVLLHNHHFIALESLGVSVYKVILSSFHSVFLPHKMSQSQLVTKGAKEQNTGKGPLRKIKIPSFDNSALIAGYAKTLIGRCMNPRMQDMRTLLVMFPRIWQVEGKVVGADLGLGRFQFDFDDEEDIVEVLKMEPFHFDYWMVSMVRWSPSVDPSYPSSLMFWVRVLGVLLQFWADPTFRAIGEELGLVKEVDINGGRVQVVIDGFKPLCFETEVEFGNGESTIVKLRYERHFGFCKLCCSLCHDSAHCPQVVENTQEGNAELSDGEGTGRPVLSYKGVVAKDRRKGNDKEGKLKAIHKGCTSGEQLGEGNRNTKGIQMRGGRERYGHDESSSHQRRHKSYAQYNEHRGTIRDGPVKGKHSSHSTREQGGLSYENTKISKPVRKSLFQDPGAGVVSAAALLEALAVCESETGSKMQQLAVETNSSHSTEAMEVIIPGIPSPHKNQNAFWDDVAEQGEVEDRMSEDSVEKDDLLVEEEESQALEKVEEETAQVLTEIDVENQARVDIEVENSASEFTKELELKSDQEYAKEELEVQTGNQKEEKKESSNAELMDKGKQSKGASLLPGASLKKRNLQRLTTPRKRPASKDPERTEEDMNPKQQEMEKGKLGGAKPPKPPVLK